MGVEVKRLIRACKARDSKRDSGAETPVDVVAVLHHVFVFDRHHGLEPDRHDILGEGLYKEDVGHLDPSGARLGDDTCGVLAVSNQPVSLEDDPLTGKRSKGLLMGTPPSLFFLPGSR